MAVRSTRNPANNHRAAALTPEQFHYAFTNTLSEEESAAVYERYAVPGPDHVLFQAALANFNPHAATTVNFLNGTRAPLLLIAGGRDHVSPPSVLKANLDLYKKSKARYRVQGVLGALALHPGSGRVGGGRRLRARLGRRARRDECSPG